ncbi:MAG: hypothetical protein MUE30_11810, partial [Spirosomaceae bacterium]|nr:hypothetical protein [Spirosomataceae bacterium]
EASAVLFDGKNTLIANDKDMPANDAAVFFTAYSEAGKFVSPAYLTQNPLKISQKYEDFALSPDGKHAFLTTAFDRIKEGSNEWDSYNALLYWPVTSSPSDIQPKILHTERGEKFSVGLRKAMSQHLKTADFPNGMPYFKIEGLAATPNKLYFGIREEGKQYDSFTYKCKIVTCSYRFEQDSLALGGDLTTLADINLAQLRPDLPPRMGISCIEYDAQRKIFWVLTSLESDTQQNCAYLWWATEADLQKGTLHLVNDRSTGQPLKFTHKAEDLTPIGGNRLLVIHDDDRNRTKIGDQTRQPHQAAYSIVKF